MNSISSSLPIVLLAGPTAVGKSEIALELAERLGTDIISADSMQVYRYMDIGTAKPSKEDRSRAVHHLIDIVDPDEPFDAATYGELARSVIDDLIKQGKIPLVVGGTGLYMKVLIRGICNGAPGDSAVRNQLLEEIGKLGLESLYAELLRVDPEVGKKLHPNDRQRIVRALEVFRLTGRPLSYFQNRHQFQERFYPTVKIFLYRERNALYDRIDQRALRMIDAGLVDEVRFLLEKGFGPDLKPMQSLGYKQIVRFILGKWSLDMAISEIQKETRRYAKRQITWFRGDPEFKWLPAEDLDSLLALVGSIRQRIPPHD